MTLFIASYFVIGFFILFGTMVWEYANLGRLSFASDLPGVFLIVVFWPAVILTAIATYPFKVLKWCASRVNQVAADIGLRIRNNRR